MISKLKMYETRNEGIYHDDGTRRELVTFFRVIFGFILVWRY